MNANKEKALAALLTYPTRKEAAKAAGISDRTMRLYFQDAEFKERYLAAFKEIIEDATRRAQTITNAAIGVLEEVMLNQEETGATRTQAAAKVVEYSLRLTEQLDIMAELAELRKAVFPHEE